VFETLGEPAGTWAQAAKKIAQHSAGASITADFRSGRDPDAVSDSDEGVSAGDETEGHKPDSPAGQWATRSKALQARLLAALKANTGDVGKMRTVFTFAQEKAAAGDFAKALLALDNLEKLLPSTETPKTDGALAGWQAAREKAVGELKAVATAVAATKDPDAPKVIVELQSIIKNLTSAPTTPQQVAEMEKYLADDVITAVEEVPPEYGKLNIRKPLLAALAKMKA
jgi:hypothetical protein